jgi:hypothetical protein
MDLEDELTRLFQDGRLDVRPAADAEEKVVAGAKRVRRRRTVLVSAAGVLGAAVLATSAVVLIARPPQQIPVADQPSLTITSSPDTVSPAPGSLSAAPNSESTPSARVKATEPPSVSERPSGKPPSLVATRPAQQPTAALRIGPDSFGKINLGMAEGELTATRSVAPAGQLSGNCTRFTLTSGGYVLVLPGQGVVEIAPVSAVTPEGITVGSTMDEVVAQYPNIANGTTRAGTGNNVYRLTFADNKVTAVHLAISGYSCS